LLRYKKRKKKMWASGVNMRGEGALGICGDKCFLTREKNRVERKKKG
jgi:hypothetical protein